MNKSKIIEVQLKANKLAPVETVTVKNPITQKETSITIERDGTPDSKLAITLADPKMSNDQKMLAASNWLMERGKDSSMFLAELFRYKGQHTKETREFKTQMKFDSDMLVNAFVLLLSDAAKTIYDDLGIRFEKDKDGKDHIFFEKYKTTADLYTAMGNLARRLELGSELVAKNHQQITKDREDAMGRGIYVDENGQSYKHD